MQDYLTFFICQTETFPWLFSVIIFRDYFPWLFSVIILSSHSNNKPCKEMQRVMLFHYESKQYASISLQNYLTSLFDKQKPVHDYFLLSLQQLVRLLQMCKNCNFLFSGN